MPRVLRLTESQLHARVQASNRGTPPDVLAFIEASGLPSEIDAGPENTAGSRINADVAGKKGGVVMDANELMLPWPPSILSPNARTHWAVKSRAAKLYRTECYVLARGSRMRAEWEGIVHAWITFYPPDRRHRDDDNLITAFKSGRDGIADALGINDKRMRIHPWLSDEVVKGGAVKVRLSPGPEA